jgi:two-component system phosphate regulon sensor histidine kinase PhoR
LIDNLYMDLESDAKLVGRWLDTTDWQNVWETMRHLSETTTRRVSILDLDGNIVADSYYPSEYFTNVSDYPEFQQALKEGVGTARRISESSNLEEFYVAVRFPKGIVRLATTSQEITAPLSFLSQAAVVLTGIMGLMAFGIAYYINRNITEPLGEMLDLTRQLQVGEFSRRVLVRSTDEIGQLSRAFNELSQTLEEMFQTVHDRENKLNAILTSMEDAVLAVDTNYKLILANRRMAEMINEDVSSLMGKDLTEAFQSYQLVEVVSDTLSTGKAIDTEIRPELSSQQVLAVTSSPLEDEAGKTIGVVIVLRDVTELRLLESMRREFVANVSHELRTPLTSIKGFVETILNGKTDDEAFVQRYLSIVSGETDRMITLINDLLDLTKIESRRQKLVFEEVNLKEIFDDTITVLASKAEEREVAVENRLDDLIVLGNPKMLRQVAINLVDNAIKYNKQGGQVWIEAAVNDGIASISVTDTGIGIPSEHLERVFERFYRVDKGRSRQMGGTGLGLSIVKHIIERHKGRIWAESEYEQGTTITFTLQVAK